MRFRGSARPVPSALLLILTLLVLTPIAGCSSSSLIRPQGPSAAEIEALERRNVELQKQATVGEIEMRRLQREVARLEAELEAVMRPSTAQTLPSAPEQIYSPPVAAEPEIEEIDLEEEPMAAISVEPTQVPSRQLEAAPSSPESNSVPPTGPRSAPTASIPSSEAQALYDQGYTLFHQRSYEEAESRFQSFVDRYPETELADNALFWIGETRYARGDFSAALEAFTATVERFPQGNKVADALLKAGKCLETLGEPEQAVATYRELTRRYAGTAAAAQAADRLDAVKQ